MSRIALSNFGATPFQQLLGHNKSILVSWTSLEEALFSSATFSPELKEQVRRNLAFLNKCPYCMAKGKPNDSEISELCALICFITACQKFGALLNLEASCDI